MFGFSPIAIIVILVIIFLIFGAGKLPELGSGIGKAIKNFKKGLSGKDEIDVTPAEHEAKKKQISGNSQAKGSQKVSRKDASKSRNAKKA